MKTSKYEPWMCETIVKVAREGGHVAAMCEAIGIKSRDTFYHWVRDIPEFGAAYETSKMTSQAFYENILLAGALGRIKNYNFPSIAMILNNKFGDEYKRSATGSSTEINIGSLTNIKTLDIKALEEKASRLLIDLKGIDEISRTEEARIGGDFDRVGDSEEV